MTTLRLPFFMALLILLLNAGYYEHATVLRSVNTHMDGHMDGLLQRIMDRTRSLRELPEPLGLTGHTVGRPESSSSSLPPRGGQQNTSHHILELHPRELRQKEKFLIHLTGPLYFNPKCRKHFYRLYHNTRDCTVPAYYKRCARLLTRLAGSPRCTER